MSRPRKRKTYTWTVVGIPNRSWKWGRRCELRIHEIGVDPMGHGYRERCLAVWGDYDMRYDGPRSALGRAVKSAGAWVKSLGHIWLP